VNPSPWRWNDDDDDDEDDDDDDGDDDDVDDDNKANQLSRDKQTVLVITYAVCLVITLLFRCCRQERVW